MNLKHFVSIVAMFAAALAASAAEAAILRFTLTGDYSATWDLNSSTTPSSFQSGAGLAFWNTPGSFSGSVQPEADLTFYNAAVGGGLNIYDFHGDLNLLAADGPQLYTGPESAPIFKLGKFALTQFHGLGAYTLNVADVSAVPEPTSALLVLTGLCVLRVARRRSPPVHAWAQPVATRGKQP